MKHANINIKRDTHYEITTLWKNKKYFFGGSFFNGWHFEFLINQIFGQKFIIFEKLRYTGKYCGNYRPSKLLLRFMEYCLDQLNSKNMKMVGNSTIQFFESRDEKKRLLLDNIFKLREYQTFGLMKMHNMNKIWFPSNKLSLWKSLVYYWRTVENVIFLFFGFSHFLNFKWLFSKIL